MIVVNDGSTDKTSFILKQYKNHPKITIIEHENQGLSLSRNKAMKIAKGKYFWFVDADDWIDKNALEILYEKTKDKKIDMVSFFTCAMNEFGSFVKMRGYDLLPEKFNSDPEGIFTINELEVWDLKTYPVTSGKQIYRREFVQKNNIEFPAHTLFEDDVFFLNTIFAGAKIAPLHRMLYYKRFHRSAITADKSKYFDSFVRICRFIWERTHQYPEHIEKATAISDMYIRGIPGRWRHLSDERRYKFYPELLSFKEFIMAQPDNEYWTEKRKWFDVFLNSERVAKFKSE